MRIGYDECAIGRVSVSIYCKRIHTRQAEGVRTLAFSGRTRGVKLARLIQWGTAYELT